MSVLSISVDGSAARPGALVPVEITGMADGQPDRNLVVTAGRPEKIQLPPGTYVLRATAPTGRRWSTTFVLEARLSVSLLEPVAGETTAQPPPGAAPTGRRPLPSRPYQGVKQALAHAQAQPQDVVTAFVCDLDQLLEPARQVVPGDSASFRVAMAARPHPVYCALARPDLPVSFVAVPPEATVRVQEGGSDDAVHWQTTVQLADAAAQTLLDHMTCRRALTAGQVSDVVVNAALRQSGKRNADPNVACVAGYYALTAEAQSLGLSWSATARASFTWSTDLLVIRAALLIRHRGAQGVAEARALLLKAGEPRLGIPRFTQGLRLLYSLLRQVVAHEEASGVIDPAAHAILGLVERYLRAADWSQPFTTFVGADPASPRARDYRLPPVHDGLELGVIGLRQVREVWAHSMDTMARSDRGLALRHASPMEYRQAAADATSAVVQRVGAGQLTFDLSEHSDHDDGASVWLLTARARTDSDAWAVVFVADATDSPEPTYAQYVIPLQPTPWTPDATGSLVMGTTSRRLDWYAAEQLVTDLDTVGSRAALERSLARAASPAVRNRLNEALAEWSDA
ncbi:hypothetical protein ACFW93_37300 [Streptomyces canus]|uniref:hypothetical protein n=1 Tax=Streptomyces canus TaxID=58343 RepID=UPI00369C488C